MTARHRDPLAARIASAGWDWPAPDWPSPPGVGAFMTTRGGGVSAAPRDSLNLALHCGDDPAAVAENRRRFVAATGARPLWLQQSHCTAQRRAIFARFIWCWIVVFTDWLVPAHRWYL